MLQLILVYPFNYDWLNWVCYRLATRRQSITKFIFSLHQRSGCSNHLSGFVILLETWRFPYFCTLIILCLTQKVKTTFNWCLDTVNGWRSPWHVIVNANKSKHFFSKQQNAKTPFVSDIGKCCYTQVFLGFIFRSCIRRYRMQSEGNMVELFQSENIQKVWIKIKEKITIERTTGRFIFKQISFTSIYILSL